jgi:hypothetical protein
MSDYKNIKNLFRGTEELPEVTPSPRTTKFNNTATFDDVFPQYSKFLQNAREEAIREKLPSYLSSPKGQDSLTGGSSNSNILSPILDTDSSNKLNQQLEYEKLSKLMLQDPKQFITRDPINEKIIEAYVKDIHPEMIQNRKISLESNDTPIDETLELMRYQKKIANEVTGVKHPSRYRMDPNLDDLGQYDRINDKISVKSPITFGIAPHEYLHKKYRDTGGKHSSSEMIYDLSRTPILADSITHDNNQHILEKLNEQASIPEPILRGVYPVIANQSPGESAFYYNKLKSLLKGQK